MSELGREVFAVESRPVKRLAVPLFAVAIGFCIACAWALAESYKATRDRAAGVAASIVTIIEKDALRNIETIDLSLRAVVDNLNHPQINSVSPELRNLILFDRSTTAHHLGAILVTDELGQVTLDSRTLDVTPTNLGEREYFVKQRDNPDLGTYIGKPIMARTSRAWILPISRRLSNPDGSFAGIAVATLKLSYFEDLFKGVALGNGSNITLARLDGTIVTRWPFKPEYVGADIRTAKIFDELRQTRSGEFETYAVTDGLHRLFAYSQIGELPLVIAVGQSTSDIFAEWRRFALLVGAMMSILCVMTAGLAIYLVREFKRRHAAEAGLARLALKDGLTELANRRQFQITLDREWARAAKTGAALSLIMIDADHFKSYNDSHGHQAGDALLKIIGSSIAGLGECAARYGGDEFVVLLPSADPDVAQKIAALLRARFDLECRQSEIEAAGLSIGIATMMPTAASDSAELIAASDQALYRAKTLGRGRTEIDDHPARMGRAA